MVLLLALASGAAALIYEVVWFQFLGLVVGSSAVSLGILLATFMGGTCLGSLLFPRLTPLHHHPLRVYAAIEIGIALTALLTLVLLPFAGKIYIAWAGEGPQGFLLRGVLAAVCLLLPTVLMGATLPALSRQIAQSDDRSSLGLLYGSNIIGAVCGSLFAGFYLLRRYDVTTAIIVAAVLNGIVAIAAALAASRTSHTAADSTRSSPVPYRKDTVVYVAIGLSGFCALAAETIWTRTLALLLGGSVYTFSLIVAV